MKKAGTKHHPQEKKPNLPLPSKWKIVGFVLAVLAVVSIGFFTISYNLHRGDNNSKSDIFKMISNKIGATRPYQR